VGSLIKSKPRKLKTIIVFLLIYVLSLPHLYSRAMVQQNTDPFTAATPSSFSLVMHNSRITAFTCSYNTEKKRFWLNWTVDHNQETNQFEIEKSSDGKNFTMAALVFGTDKSDSDNYQFYEKARSKKMYYRIKIIYKDNSTEYSDIMVVELKSHHS
jgi:hypothetical protein